MPQPPASVIPTVLGFGDVVCQTASGAGGGAFRIIGVPKPGLSSS